MLSNKLVTDTGKQMYSDVLLPYTVLHYNTIEWKDNSTMYCDRYWPGKDNRLLEFERIQK